MKHLWLVIVSRKCAKEFEIRNAKLKFLKKYINPFGDLKKREFRLDKPGHGRGKFAKNPSVHSLDGEKEPTRQVAQSFAHKLSQLLVKDFAKYEVSEVTIAAEPHMLGFLRKVLPSRNLKIKWLEKDLATFPTKKISEILRRNHLPEMMT